MGLRHLGFAMAAVRDCIWRIFSVLIIVLARGRVFVLLLKCLFQAAGSGAMPRSALSDCAARSWGFVLQPASQ